MFAKLAILTMFATLVVTTPMPQSGTAAQCSASLQCCKVVQDPNDLGLLAFAASLGIPIDPAAEGPIGVSCDPMVTGGPTCIDQPACCSGQSFDGIFTLECVPVRLT